MLLLIFSSNNVLFVESQVGYLKQIDTSGYPEEVSLLKIMATFETHTRLRVKIIDAENKRYEVNVLDTIQVTDESPVLDADYEFSINMDIPGFSVTRKSNKQVSCAFSVNENTILTVLDIRSFFQQLALEDLFMPINSCKYPAFSHRETSMVWENTKTLCVTVPTGNALPYSITIQYQIRGETFTVLTPFI